RDAGEPRVLGVPGPLDDLGHRHPHLWQIEKELHFASQILTCPPRDPLPELSLGPAQNDQTIAKSPAPPTNAQIAQTNPMWWSGRMTEPEGTAITPFTVAVPDDDLLELKRRLTSARWPEKETVEDW